MAGLPKISNCPILDDESLVCMCMNLDCDGEVDTKVCYAIRNAYQYGCDVTENKYLNEFKEICGLIVNRMDELQKET